MPSRWLLALVASAPLFACQRANVTPEPTPPAPVASAPATGSKEAALPPRERPSQKVTPLAVCQAHGQEPLEAARTYYDAAKYEEALSCAAQAAALQPENPLAHSERGASLAALGRYDEAQTAYARALAIDPDHLDALLGAAHLYGVTLASSRERDELGVTYSEKGLALAQAQNDKELTAEFALLSAMAFNDLGQSKEAVERADTVLSIHPKSREATYERAVALFELCRFSEAKTAFATMAADTDRGAHAHYHLGLILEREGKQAEADKHFAKAHALSPEDFPAPQLLSPEEFKAEVAKAIAALPEDMKRDLKGVPVTADDLPRDDDLLGGEPPLSPAILGLYRGPPLNEACSPEDGAPCRSVALYRRNLARAVKTREELLEQIRVTLLHEVGHLRGEDDFELAARGLE